MDRGAWSSPWGHKELDTTVATGQVILIGRLLFKHKMTYETIHNINVGIFQYH